MLQVPAADTALLPLVTAPAAVERRRMHIAEIKKYVDDIARAMGEMSNRNLNVTPGQPFIGDFKPIEFSIGKMLMDLTSALSQFKAAAQQVSSGASQVSSGAQILAQGATQQASSVEQLVASVSEVSSQIQHNAEFSNKASEMAHTASIALEQSYDQMQNLMSSMRDIEKRSVEIRSINKTIDDIAFQTNILALNAAVEAARAGDAGKGFAVVADEVRALAGKSAEAAKNTTALVDASIQAIDTGVELAQITANNMEKVVNDSNQTTSVIQDISRATQDQANAIKQITLGLDQISAVVQSNSATSEESAAVSEELHGQATLLQELSCSFRLLETEGR